MRAINDVNVASDPGFLGRLIPTPIIPPFYILLIEDFIVSP